MNNKERTSYLVSRTALIVGILFLLGSGCQESKDNDRPVVIDPAVVDIEQVFADNFPENTESISVQITESEGDLVKGIVSMIGIDSHVFYAAKVDGEWDVIYDKEQNPYECSLLSGYAFSEKMMIGCEAPADEFTVEDAQEIQQVFAEKYTKDIEDIIIKIDQYTTDYARGNIQFAGEMGGGIFLATKVDGVWEVVVDGNGAYECSSIERYGFPDDMVADCY